MIHEDEHGHLVDPIQKFHENHGAKISDIVYDYRPLDHEITGN